MTSSTLTTWKTILLLGAPRPPVLSAFLRVTRNTSAVGRLILDGDSVEFAVLFSRVNMVLGLVMKVDNRPFHRPTLDLLIPTATAIAFADGTTGAARYKAEVESLARPGTCIEAVTWSFAPQDPSSSFEYATLVERIVSREVGPDHITVERTPSDLPVLTFRFDPCFGGKVWGWGLQHESLRADIPITPRQ